MNPLKDKEVIWLDDRVGGRQGTLKRIYDCEEDGDTPVDPDIDGKKLEYYPLRDLNKSWRATLKEMIWRDTAEKASMIFPASAYSFVSKSHPDTGEMMKYVVIEEDQYGNAPFEERREKERERTIKKLESKLNSLRKQAGLQEVEHKAQHDESKRKGEKPPSSSSSKAEDALNKIKEKIGKG